MSMNASVRSSERTIVAGSSPATILQKMQSTSPVYCPPVVPPTEPERLRSAAAAGVGTGIWLQTSLL
jgi:hypothetical protein